MAYTPPLVARWSRRLATWLGFTFLTLLLSGNAGAQHFDRAAELARYRAWLAIFKHDLDRLADTPHTLSDTELDAMFAGSVVPGSRGSAFVRQTFTRRAADGAYSPHHGPRRVLMAVLDSAIPAGQGGRYPEKDPTLGGTDLTVWYLHVDVGDMANTYLLSDEHFKPYRLPPPGTLERNAYPFVLMDIRGATPRLGGVSAELWGLITYLHNAAL
ncbi:hypothetical protein ACFWXM_15510 [Achromobacter xylosoxidans]|uniref:hypothetical protein n=1 Tax=Alcaligenes xylosoxydans xylosoxydans TaxID=85698 RepID=UPI0006C0CA7E|nr:hypothetical protein [Achromobacter xylosoxidans]MEC6412775.1 hypothetical protein [Achromobacter xylosoxidans]CUJ39733.1 Uncharacterised protein [Achromobacter xylosoxidans]